MKLLTYALIRVWRRLFPPYRHYWMYVNQGWFHEQKRLEIVSDIHWQPFLRGEMREQLMQRYETMRDVCWAKADELMRTPGRSEL